MGRVIVGLGSVATPLEDVVASVHSPGHAGFIILMPRAGLSMQCSAALMLWGKALLAPPPPPHEARRVEPDSMAWGLHGHSDTGPGIIGGGWPFVKYQPYNYIEKGLHTPEHAWPLPLLGGN